MPTIIDLRAITADWLTGRLQRAGVLTSGSVTGFTTQRQDSTTSRAAILRLKYSPDAPDSAPRALFYKTGTRQPEVHFYRQLAPMIEDFPVPCYYAAFDSEAGHSALLMKDVRDVYLAAEEAGTPPDDATLYAMVSHLAGFHRRFWEMPALLPGEDLHRYMDDVPGYVLRHARENFPGFVRLMGDRLPVAQRRIYEKVLAALPLPAWTQRLAQNRAVTVAHGDAHFWNFLYPRAAGAGPILVDWAVWHRNLGVGDVAYLLFTGYDAAGSRAREKALVTHYHRQLAVSDYDFATCWHDYRLSLVQHMVWPLFWYTYLPEDLWLDAHHVLMASYSALGLADLM